MTEREKMLAGELYDPHDAELVAARTRARDLLWTLNATRESDAVGRRGRLAPAAVLLRLRLEHPSRHSGVLQLQLRGARRVRSSHRRPHALRPRGADLRRDAPARCRASQDA